ncbi:Sjogren's syndrome/scleroderma autoantigen 1 family protein [Natronorubrum texcoconense]|uniref:Sjogren's syndrome/scleroderma autoantigen 1 (Autoantigen p27) n=1 Tax=Natronorubrum texcoconense TaxID=1095776 RepID=A0A1G9GDM8_9EURY|nr:Sjogren's syndrome/scleroderma autoantigen 1 family protein [Natronorubrum texcoconense]SDK98712.1 Sjogren's syndrome/scleroderma autoantigen 1 (Autoantigen p27) [Natronorubrum texcoconense]
MSDFDKEAEREKLREKYERDEREREATQRMSDLLLKGATMTNAHCGTCGDPLFQEDGTTFCPSCHGNPDAVQGTELEAQPADEAAEEGRTEANQQAGSAPNRAPQSPDDEGADETAVDRSPAVDSAAARGHDPVDSGAQDDSSPEIGSTPDPAVDSSTGDEPRPETPSPTPSPRSFEGRRPAADSSPADGDLESAHASLVQSLEKFARKAAETDDPRYAKECLEAAREASETLETLR